MPTNRHLIAVPEVLAPRDSITLTPASFPSWAAMFRAHPSRADYLLTPGDYTGWGTLAGLPGDGTAARKRVIRCVDAVTPPWKRRGSEALVARFDVSGVHHWILHGLTIRRPVLESYIQGGAARIIVDSLLMEGMQSAYGIRRRDCDHTAIQRSVIRDFVPTPGGDKTAIQDRLLSRTMIDNRVVSCEFRNVGDAIQSTDSNTFPNSRLENAIYADIECYANSNWYTQNGTKGGTENGIDVKVAGSSAATAMLIEDVAVWGMRYTDSDFSGSGSDSAGIVFHVLAEHVNTRRALVWDGPLGFKVSSWSSGEQVSRNLRFYDCVAYAMKQFAAEDTGAAMRCVLPEQFVNCVFSGCTTVASVATVAGTLDLHSNTAVGTPLGVTSSAWAAGTRNVARTASEMSPLTTTRYRLTNPQTIQLPGCVYREPLGGAGWALRSTYGRSRGRRR